ncbi:MAG TPA: PhoPQ-activated protein PqaA family protein [Candidatus Limnocylindria bacterium]|nr:PhoPQ-activated protein PqaA family protein [Candidatus Limnocylindria bacterium]
MSTLGVRLTRSQFLIGSLGAIGAGTLLTAPLLAGEQGALDRYVAAHDPAYRFRLVSTPLGEGHTAYVLEMISQRWRSAGEVDRTEWHHWLTIVVPPLVTTRVAALVISGGSNGDDPPRHVSSFLVRLARQIQGVVAELRMVPNQPLRFAGEEKERGEDELIAYTWDKFLRTDDELWPLRLPMTKSAVRAMDTISAFCADVPGVAVDRFIVGGASKRGWTAWTTAAADRRVVAVVPVVVDTLNVEESAEHAYRVYGSWPPALRAYQELGIMRWIGTPRMEALMRIEDPYAYRERLTMPKFIVNSAGDEFFVPDSSRYYFGALPGEKYLRYVPNTDHSLKGQDAAAADDVLAFCRAVIDDAKLPRFSWGLDADGAIVVRSEAPPSRVTFWHAANGEARDFRFASIGKAFKGTPLRDQGNGTYVGMAGSPRHGWIASFVELEYPTAEGRRVRMTTEVSVTPDVLPFQLPVQGA